MRPGLVRYYVLMFSMIGAAAIWWNSWFAVLGIFPLVELGCDLREAAHRAHEPERAK